MKKKIVAVLLASFMASSVMACGQNAASSQVSEDTENSTTDESVESDSTEEAIAEASDESATESVTESAETESDETEELSTVRTTAYGDVEGIENGDCITWYGVPYAKAPVDELRWSNPEDPDSWSDVLDCTEAAEVAIQCGTDYSTGETVVKGSEDCLNLDIYATEDAENLPVLVYIHGGNNQTGSSSEIEGSQIVVDENCVYVSLNYRLGILGFNCLPALQTEEDSTGNYAMLDIAKALDWVKANIEAFGGDADNITISGFSAGGRDVMAMLISPLFEGKFDKAVVYSGGMTVADEDASARQIAAAVAPLAVEDGMADDTDTATEWLLSDGEDVKEYLYSIDAERLCTLMANAGIRMSVFPHLYTDGVVIPEEGFDTTSYNSVPVLMLTGSTEFSLFNNFDGFYSSDAVAEWDEETLTAAKEFGCTYGSDIYRIFNAQCSAEKMFDSYDSDIYLCQVDYGSANSEAVIDGLGAFHGVFVPMLTDQHSYSSFYDFNVDGYQDMASLFDAYLGNFLATGDPNGDGLTTWNAWTTDAPESLVLDANDTTATAEMKDVSSSYDDIMDAMDADETVDSDVKETIIQNVMNGRWFSDALDTRYDNESLWK